jgi:hypothetical protein
MTKAMKSLHPSGAVLRLAALIALLPGAAGADSFALILSGIPPTPEHETRFAEWTDATRTALTDRFGLAAGDVVVLSRPNADDIRAAFADLGGRVGEDDVFYLFFIGHGDYDGRDYKFAIARADLTASDYNDLLSGIDAGRIVVVNASTSSGASIEALRAPNRVILTATRSGTERNDTIFYGQFLEALESPASDEDLNNRLSVWEAFRYAAMGTARSYEERNLLATEHAQISDNGGDQTGADPEEIPTLAQLTYFNVISEVAVGDPELRALLADRDRLEAAIAALRLERESMPEREYDQRLEDLLVELAIRNQEIRAREPAGATPAGGTR